MGPVRKAVSQPSATWDGMTPPEALWQWQQEGVRGEGLGFCHRAAYLLAATFMTPPGVLQQWQQWLQGWLRRQCLPTQRPTGCCAVARQAWRILMCPMPRLHAPILRCGIWVVDHCYL